MSTNGLTSWAVDLKDVGVVYPFSGTEVILTIAAIAFWLGWHVLQAKVENKELSDSERDFDKEHASKSIDRR